ncbi:MAG: bifunctional nuclease family protein [Salibacteraceae bacterium]
MENEKIKLEILGLSYSQTQTGAYALVLGEVNGKRRLPIIIGNFEAQAIAIELEKMRPSRPLTHDIFKSFADTFNIAVNEVIIYKLVEGIFFAKLICQDATGRVEEIDTRTSDAIALAVRFNCEIYTYEHILASAGIILEDDTLEAASTQEQPVEDLGSGTEHKLAKMSVDELKRELQKAIDEENYERATILRDEIKRRS